MRRIDNSFFDNRHEFYQLLFKAKNVVKSRKKINQTFLTQLY